MTTENNQQQEEEILVPEIMNSGAEAISAIVKSEIDMQISTAKAYPRSLAVFRKKVKEMATINEDIAEACTYALPTKEKVGNSYVKKTISGPSVRLAEIACSCYGNVRAGSRIISNDGKRVISQGVFHDLESNVSITTEVSRSIRTKEGKMYSDHLQSVTANAACSIAFRNIVFKGLFGMITDVYEEVKKVARGTEATLGKRREKAIAFFTERKIKLEQILEVLGVQGIEEIDLDKLAILSGMKASIVNNEVTDINELFPGKDDKNKGEKANGNTLNMMDSKKKDGKKSDAKTDQQSSEQGSQAS